MAEFRGSEEALDREIEVLEEIARIRLRRAARELREMERELRWLKGERARRRAASPIASPAEEAHRATVASDD